MEYSKRLKEEAKKYSVPVQTLVMADLMAIGYTANEAYTVAYQCNATFSQERNITIRDNIISSAGFNDMVRERSAKHGRPELMENDELRSQYSKEEIASMLRAQIENLPDGSKEKADVLMKYADLFAYKKEEKKAEEEDIKRVWLPLTCDICPYKNNYESKD